MPIVVTRIELSNGWSVRAGNATPVWAICAEIRSSKISKMTRAGTHFCARWAWPTTNQNERGHYVKIGNFFAELKRRNVYKVAVAYAVVGWLVIQVTATIVPALHLPDSLTTAVVVLILVGFP